MNQCWWRYLLPYGLPTRPQWVNREAGIEINLLSGMTKYLGSREGVKGHLHLRGWWRVGSAAALRKFTGSRCADMFAFTYMRFPSGAAAFLSMRDLTVSGHQWWKWVQEPYVCGAAVIPVSHAKTHSVSVVSNFPPATARVGVNDPLVWCLFPELRSNREWTPKWHWKTWKSIYIILMA